MLHRALELRPDQTAELGLWRAIGRANALKHDGEPFLAAMNRAIALAPDRATAAELYAELSFESALRAGMWRRRPSRELVDGWIDRALELADPESPARARALIARCDWAPLGSAAEAREASAIAERLGDPDLRSYAWDARAITLWVSGENDLGRAMEERRFELLDQIHDPDHIADIHYAPVTGCIWLGYFDEARRLAGLHDEITSVLTPHHRIHGVAVRVEVEELVGTWESIQALEPRAEETIVGNLDTPCVRSPRSLLVCAVAAARPRRPSARAPARSGGRRVRDGGLRPRARHAAAPARARPRRSRRGRGARHRSAARPRLAPRLAAHVDPRRPARRARTTRPPGRARGLGTHRAPARISSRSISARSVSSARTSSCSSARSPPSRRSGSPRHAADTRAVLA